MSKVIRATSPIIDDEEVSSQEVETEIKQYSPFTRVELNLEKFSIWSPKPRRGTKFIKSKVVEYESEHLPDGSRIERKIEIVPSAKYGYPTTETQECCYGLIKLWWNEPDLDVKRTGKVLFSRKQLITDVLGLKYSSSTRRSVELWLRQMSSTQLEYHHLFYDKEKDITHADLRNFQILRDLQLTTKKQAGEIVHDKCLAIFHPLIVSNLLSGHYKPVLTVFSEINSEIGRILYTKLDLQFSHHTKYEISTERFFRENGLVGGEYHQPGRRKRLLEKAIQELVGKPTSSGAVIAKYGFARTADGKDWKLIVRAKGKRLRESAEAEVVNISQASAHQERPSQKPCKPRQEAKKAQYKETPTLVSEKPPQGDSGLQELSTIFEDLTSSAEVSGEVNAQALELLRHFDSVFGLSSDLNQNDVPKAELFVERYSLSAGKFLVDFAHRQGSEPTRFSDILSYRAEALEAFKHQRQPQESKDSEGKVVSLNANPGEPDLKAIHYFHSKFGGRIQASDKVRSKVQNLIKAHTLDFAIFLVDFAHKKISETNSSYKPNSFSGILSSQNEALEEWEKGKQRKKREEIQAQKLEEMRREAQENEIYRAHRQEYFASIDGIYERVKCVCPERIKEFEDYWISKKENQGESASRFYQPRRAQALVEFFKADIDIDFPEFSEWYSNSLRSN